MAKTKFHKPKNITPIVQGLYFQRKYSQIITKKYKTLGLHYDMQVKPTEDSKKYNLKFMYKSLNDFPHIYVKFEDLGMINYEDLPHKYGKMQFGNKEYIELCLWCDKDWRKQNDKIADTIICWAIEWLYFYEIWLITDEWLGGGKEHKTYKKMEMEHE